MEKAEIGKLQAGVNSRSLPGEEGLVSLNSSIINTVILQQQKRIAELENELQRSRNEVWRIKSSAKGGTGVLSAASVDSRVETTEVAGSITKKRATSIKKVSDTSGQTRYWTADEHARFLVACGKYGWRNYVAVSNYVGTRTPRQVRTHAQKYEVRLAREARARVDGNVVRTDSRGKDLPVRVNPPAVEQAKSSAVSFVTLESEPKEEYILGSVEKPPSSLADDGESFDMEIFQLENPIHKSKELSDHEFDEEWFLNVDQEDAVKESMDTLSS